ncbi:MAG: dienelactone hydrolase [Planctomycetaceae bacterium]|nr:dienelactone hydrolase [Planctomycetaceae bacterium]
MQRWTWLIVFVTCFALGVGRFRTRGQELEPSNSSITRSAPSVAAWGPGEIVGDYDPRRAIVAGDTLIRDYTVADPKRKRDIPIRIYLPPATTEPQPVVLFSHGLGGSREGSKFLGQHWSKRGYVAVFLQHPGSDESVWKGESLLNRRRALVQAANGEQLAMRLGDVPAVLDQLEKWNQTTEHELAGKLNLQRVGMSGHSFGAVTTQNMSGQSNPLGRSNADPRIRAAVVMSPGIPAVGSPERAFRGVKIPWMLMTGTHDGSPIGEQTPESRRQVFPALPAGDKYELVLNEAEHSIFTDHKLAGEQRARKPEHHRAIEAISTAFWDAYLREDPAAKAWLQSDQARAVLAKADQWQMK